MVMTTPTSNTVRASSVTTTTPAITLSRNGACSSRLGRVRTGDIRLRLIGTRLAFIGAGLACARLVAGPGQAQAETDRALGVDQVRPVTGQFAPQVGHIGRHDRAGAAEVVVPHVAEDLGAGEHTTRVEHEVAQQPELGRRQLDEAPATADLVAVLVEREVRERQHWLGNRVAGPAQHGAGPGDEVL